MNNDKNSRICHKIPEDDSSNETVSNKQQRRNNKRHHHDSHDVSKQPQNSTSAVVGNRKHFSTIPSLKQKESPRVAPSVAAAAVLKSEKEKPVPARKKQRTVKFANNACDNDIPPKKTDPNVLLVKNFIRALQESFLATKKSTSSTIAARQKRRERKREINRQSAQRKRQREKGQIDELSQEYNNLVVTNQNLKLEREQLRQAVTLLKQYMAGKGHLPQPQQQQPNMNNPSPSSAIPSVYVPTSGPVMMTQPTHTVPVGNQKQQNSSANDPFQAASTCIQPKSQTVGTTCPQQQQQSNGVQLHPPNSVVHQEQSAPETRAACETNGNSNANTTLQIMLVLARMLELQQQKQVQQQPQQQQVVAPTPPTHALTLQQTQKPVQDHYQMQVYHQTQVLQQMQVPLQTQAPQQIQPVPMQTPVPQLMQTVPPQTQGTQQMHLPLQTQVSQQAQGPQQPQFMVQNTVTTKEPQKTLSTAQPQTTDSQVTLLLNELFENEHVRRLFMQQQPEIQAPQQDQIQALPEKQLSPQPKQQQACSPLQPAPITTNNTQAMPASDFVAATNGSSNDVEQLQQTLLAFLRSSNYTNK